jgi:hypothetical protein
MVKKLWQKNKNPVKAGGWRQDQLQSSVPNWPFPEKELCAAQEVSRFDKVSLYN